VWHDSFICVTWLIHICDMTRWYMWHDSLIYMTWLIHISVIWLVYSRMASKSNISTKEWQWDASVYTLRHDSFIRAISRIHMSDMTRLYQDGRQEQHTQERERMMQRDASACMWHDSFIRATWLIRMCDVTHSYVRHDSFLMWPIHTRMASKSNTSANESRSEMQVHIRDMTHSSVQYALFKDLMCLIHTRMASKSNTSANESRSEMQVWLDNQLEFDTEAWLAVNIYEWVMSHIRMSYVAYMNESRDIHEWVMTHVWIISLSSTSRLGLR